MKLKTACIFTVLILLTACNRHKNDSDASGVFEATEVIVSAQTEGILTAFNINEGDDLEMGAVVGQVDRLQLELRKAQLEANVKAAESRLVDITVQVAPLQQEIDTQKRELARFEALVKSHAANAKQADDIRSQVLNLERQLAAQKETLSNSNTEVENEISSLKIQIAQAEDQISKSILTAPVKGTVLAKYAEPGEYAQPGKALFKMADLRQMNLRAYITSDQLTQLKLGQDIQVLADFGEDEMREYDGTLIWIADKAEFTPKTIPTRNERANLVYAVKVSVNNDGYLKKGMYGEVKFNPSNP